MKLNLLILALCSSIPLFAQKGSPKDYFTTEISKVKADFNKDGLPDYAIVQQNQKGKQAPYRLQIFFGQADGSNKLVLSSTKAIEAQYAEGKEDSGKGFLGLSVKNNVLSIDNELTRGHFEHKFRFQNSNFELIGFTEVSSDGHGQMETTDFNLSTGIRNELVENYETDKTISKTQKKVMIRPLPKLQDFRPFATELY